MLTAKQALMQRRMSVALGLDQLANLTLVDRQSYDHLGEAFDPIIKPFAGALVLTSDDIGFKTETLDASRKHIANKIIEIEELFSRNEIALDFEKEAQRIIDHDWIPE